MEIKWCIECEKNVCVDVPDGHTIFVPDGNGEYEVDFCYGTFTSCPPPANFIDDGADGNWDLYLDEPTQEELAIMNCHAEELWQDFDYEDLKF